eukprot:1995217-Rhodomonas_salina.1
MLSRKWFALTFLLSQDLGEGYSGKVAMQCDAPSPTGFLFAPLLVLLARPCALMSVSSCARQAILEDAHDRTVRALAWSPGEDRIATASFDGTCVVWTKKGGEYEQVATLQGHENEVKSVAFDPSGKLLATCRSDSLLSSHKSACCRLAEYML